ncbi:hypothetical protein FA95DRAFT_1595075 [Auriscalpium vulgare]|uniref:Uncharacterized protein n=1 Tax=Auriscalpium vulgare TaxID=40419 RepID=A0ACB8RWC7_9AGAM|nr:hypothetical protein FA95DRAFT_1595075 [Auriscalpium vulgare]
MSSVKSQRLPQPPSRESSETRVQRRPPHVVIERPESYASFTSTSSSSSSSSSSLPSYRSSVLDISSEAASNRRRPLPQPPVPNSPTPSYTSTAGSTSSGSRSSHETVPRSSSISSSMVPERRDSRHALTRMNSATSMYSASLRPLPKTPSSAPARLEVPKSTGHSRSMSSPPVSPISPADSFVSFILPQKPADVKDVRRKNLSKLRRHLGQSVPADLVLPPPELSDESDSDVDTIGGGGLSFATLSELSEAISPHLPNPPDRESIKRASRRWLREKKGMRWEEENYDAILQSLRALK